MSSPGSYLSGEVILEEVEAASLPCFRYIIWGDIECFFLCTFICKNRKSMESIF